MEAEERVAQQEGDRRAQVLVLEGERDGVGVHIDVPGGIEPADDTATIQQGG